MAGNHPLGGSTAADDHEEQTFGEVLTVVTPIIATATAISPQ
ncbi:hypothetical protein [Streptomyces niveus]|nr:hypothetical protein [Streptomyces niveus]